MSTISLMVDRQWYAILVRRWTAAFGVLLFCAWAMNPAQAYSQSTAVRGFITDDSDGEPLQGVNVILESGTGLFRGTATTADGFYALAGIPAGRYVFKASFIGYMTQVDTLNLGADEIKLLSVVLVPDEAALDEVLVESDRSSGAARVRAGQQTVSPADIELVPMPDVSGDLAAYLTTLPGVVTTGDRGGQLFIRGGEPWHNLVLIDGMAIYQPFHVLGFYSAFPVDIISRADVYAGGYGSRYGGRLSSVIDVNTRSGNKKRMAGSVSVAPFVSGVLLEGPLIEDRFSFLLSGRQSVIEQGASRLVDTPLPFRFGDVYAKVHGNISDNNQTSLSLLRTYDRGTLVQAAADLPQDEPLGRASAAQEQQIRWVNQAYGGRHIILPKSFPILAEILVSVSRLKTEFGPADAPSRTSTIGQINASVNVTYFAGPVDVNWGLFAHTLEVSSELGGLFQELSFQREYLTEAGLYFETDVRLGPSLKVRPGLRLQNFASRDQVVLEPRLRVVWIRGIQEVSAAAGVYHQEIAGLNDRRDAASVFTVWAPTPLGKVPRAVHGILGYRVNPLPWLEMAAEGFVKQLTDLFVPEWTAFPRLTTRLQPAEGHAVGLDLRLEVRRAAFYGYINYGRSSVTYEAKQETLALWYGTETLSYHPPHDRQHQVNALASVTVKGFDLGVRWQFGSGLPFNRALGFDGFILMDGTADPFTTAGSRRVIYERPFNGRLPTYHRLDVSIERGFMLGRTQATVQGSLINAYDRSNIFYLDVFTQRRVDQLPLIPSLGFKLAFE